jgi:hypothetical protein
MVIYREKDGPRAIYFDNEGHVIRYGVVSTPDSVSFVSDSLPTAPRYRLTYTKGGTDRVAIAFDIAPPNAPGSFSRYIQAAAHRKP